MTLPIDALQSRRRIIVHKKSSAIGCPDGRATALFLKAALPHADVREIAYNSPEHRELAAEPGLIFGDFSPPRDRLHEFVAAGAVAIDHHTRDLVEPFGELGVFGQNDLAESGAVLACREVLCRFCPGEVSNLATQLARLVGVRDTWQTKSPDWDAACAVSEALAFVPLNDLLDMGIVRFMRLADDLGPMLLRKTRDAAAEAAAKAIRWLIRGQRVAVVSSAGLVSDAADVIGDTAEIVAGFKYVQDGGSQARLVVSLRSRGAVNVTEIAKRYGGGGHESGGAAGFPELVSVHDPGMSPYELVYERLDDALSNGVGLR